MFTVEPSRMQCREAVRLLLSLGMARDMPTLACRFPHILNRVSDLWVDAELTERYLEEIVFSERQDRIGFPPAAMAEIAKLQERNRVRLIARKPGDRWSVDIWR